MNTIRLKHPDDDKPFVHIRASFGDYATVCGLATDGDEYSAVEVKGSVKKVTCSACHAAWSDCQGLTAKDFNVVA